MPTPSMPGLSKSGYPANETPARIVELIKQYDVDVIEVVGHTDEQRISSRPSNLDGELLPVLRNAATVSNLVPADNAGLGLARAVSVLSVLHQSPLLQDYKLIPLSGAQLVNTDETLAISGNSGDIPERRRIEIRLRKSRPKDTTATIEAVTVPKPKPVRRPKPKLTAPLQLGLMGFLGKVPRAGDVTSDGPAVIEEGIESIDVTSVGNDLFSLNHSTFASNPVIEDIGRLISKGEHPPNLRTSRIFGMPLNAIPPRYWRYVD
jgi:hypothetical protein